MFTFLAVLLTFSLSCYGSILQKYIEFCEIKNCMPKLCKTTGENQTSGVTNSGLVDGPTDWDYYKIEDIYCCGNCTCDVGCFKRGDCCPDMLTFNESQYPPGGVYVCMDTLYIDSKNRNVRRSYYTVIGRCPITNNNSVIASKCQSTSDEKEYKVHVPVFDSDSGESFRNKYCAMCNLGNDFFLKSWNSISKCETGDKKSEIKNDSCTRHIDVWYPPPEEPEPEVCIPVYDRCNVTGFWEEYDEEIDIACSSFRMIFRGKYQNIFCYMCNKETTIHRMYAMDIYPEHYGVLFTMKTDSDEIEELTPRPSYSGVLAYDHSEDIHRHILCLNGFHYDNTTTTCVPGELLCSTVILKIETQDPRSNINQLIQCFLWKLLTRIVGKEIKWSCTRSVVLNEAFTSVNNTLTCQATFQYDASVVDSILAYQDKIVNVSSQKCSNSTDMYSFKVYLDADSKLAEPSYDYFAQMSRDIADSVPDENIYEQNTTCKDARLVRVSYLLHCPVVALNTTYLNITTNGIYIDDIARFLKPYQFVSQNSNSDDIYVCLKDLVIVPNGEAKDDPELEHDLIMNYLTIVLSSVSIASSMFSFVTYVNFPTLRSQPGINNMILCISVFIGQLLFILGIKQYGFKTLCVAIGVALHFSWMFIVVWMSVCCFHMFRVFRSSLTISRTENNVRTTVIYVLVAYFLSLLPVLTNIIYFLTITHGKHFGYGPKLCWISNPAFVGYTMSLPALLLVIANIVVFSCAIASIKQTPNVQSTVRNRQFTYIYLKLSTLTGVTWLSVIPVILTDIKIFEYIFTILFASQGLFIMLAFMCNKRTFNLYKSSWHKIVKDEHDLQTSTQLTMIKSSQQRNA